MIHETRKNGWRFFYAEKKYADSFGEILDRLDRRAGTVLGENTASRRPRLILKAELPSLRAGTPFVLKREWFSFRFDRSLKSFFSGSNARIILKASLRAEAKGFSDFCRTFFVAERSRFGILRETISVIEFLDGRSLDRDATLRGDRWEIAPAVKEEARRLLESCHRAGIVSGDVHPGNFFRTESDGRLKLIDFRGNKLLPAVAAARDRIQMECLMGIPNEKHDWGEKVFRAHLALRNFFRKVCGREHLSF